MDTSPSDFDGDILSYPVHKTYTLHSTRLKRFINPILRKIQYKTNKPWVIASCFNKNVFSHYTFARVGYEKDPDYSAVTINYLPTGKEIRTTFKYYWNKLIYG